MEDGGHREARSSQDGGGRKGGMQEEEEGHFIARWPGTSAVEWCNIVVPGYSTAAG